MCVFLGMTKEDLERPGASLGAELGGQHEGNRNEVEFLGCGVRGKGEPPTPPEASGLHSEKAQVVP